LPDWRRICKSTVPVAVDVGDRILIRFAVLDACDVANADGMAGHFAHHHIAEGATFATRPRVRSVIDCGPCVDPATGRFDVLGLQRPRHVGDCQV